MGVAWHLVVSGHISVENDGRNILNPALEPHRQRGSNSIFKMCQGTFSSELWPITVPGT
jgi:hypothetical protein